ncbi:MAG TPA: hypothetical protein VJQ56_10655, partial [Blastocatellia bacterium]|nr:hypothetical protein [Blastocatellia bacterium]
MTIKSYGARLMVAVMALCYMFSFTLVCAPDVAAQTPAASLNDRKTSDAPAAAQPATKPASVYEPIKIAGITFSGSLRVRVEDYNWFETSKADGNYTFGAAQLRLSLGQQKESLDWQVEGAFPWLINLPDNAIAAAPQGQLGLGPTYFAASGTRDVSAVLKQAYVRFKGIAGDKASSLRIGRFEFSDGSEVTPKSETLATIKRDQISQRLIGPFGFSHIGRSFDGLQYVRNTKES